MLFIISTMLFSIDEAATVVETGENNIDWASLFVIVIIVAQPCWQVVTVLMVEQCCKQQPCYQVVTILMVEQYCNNTVMAKSTRSRLPNLQQVVRFHACSFSPILLWGLFTLNRGVLHVIPYKCVSVPMVLSPAMRKVDFRVHPLTAELKHQGLSPRACRSYRSSGGSIVAAEFY